jgi:nucleoside-diphosphate-sugar epimerase
MGIRRYIFMSIFNCDKHPEVPLMNIKAATEEFLKSSSLPHTTLRLCGFHQAVIGNYAVPILEDRTVWGTNDDSRTAYMDTQDIARLTLAALRSEACEGRTLTFAGPQAYTTKEVIDMCASMSDSNAQVTSVPTWLLRATRNVLKSADWARDAADRLAFAEVLGGDANWSAPMDETYELLGVDPASITGLEQYLQEYFSRIMKKLKEVGATADRTNFYV